MYLIGAFVGGLLPTFFLSRLFLWLLKKYKNDFNRILVANGLSLATCALLTAFFMTLDRPGFAFGPAFLQYLIPQLVWLGIDIFACKGRKHKALEHLPPQS